MKKELVCIICPRGCALSAEINGDSVTVTGQSCPKGEQYAKDECIHPTRTVTSVVRVSDRRDAMVSVKTASPVPKENIPDVMRTIREASVLAPVKIGDVIISDVYGTDIIATKNID